MILLHVKDIRGVSIGLDTKEKAATHSKFVDFPPYPAPFTHIHRWQSVCVRGSETGTKLPKIYINLYLLNLLLNLMLVSGSGWRVFLGTLGGFETLAVGSCLCFG
jgi:hypothetical protein